MAFTFFSDGDHVFQPIRKPKYSKLNLKKSHDLSAPHRVQKVLRFDDIPKFFPDIISRNIITAIIGPETYQGHGS